MTMTKRIALCALLLLGVAVRSYAQAPAVFPGKVRVTSTAADALCVGASTVSPASTACTGGLYVGPIIANGVVLGPNGSTSAPTFAFANDTNTGIYSVSGDVIGIVTGGTERFRIGAGGNMVPVGGNSYNIGDATNTIRDIYVAGLAEFANGSNSAPSITFLSDTDSGMYRVGADNIAFAVGGARAWGIDNSQAGAWTNSAGNIVDPQGTPSVTAGGGTGAAVSAGKDYSFRGTTGSTASTTLTVTFERTFTSAPSCTANLSSTNAVGIATTTTTVVLTYPSVTSNNFFVNCRGF